MHHHIAHCRAHCDHMGIEHIVSCTVHPIHFCHMAGHVGVQQCSHLQSHIQVTHSMKQKHKQQLVNKQINQIRTAIKALQHMTKTGMYLDVRQRNAVACITDLELAPLAM